MKKFNILPYLAIFLSTYLILNWWMGSKPTVDTVLTTGDIGMKTAATEYVVGSDIQIELQNNTTESITLPARCPDARVDIYQFTSSGYTKVENTETDRDCSTAKDLVLTPGDPSTISLLDYSYSLFGTPGKYKVSLTEGDQTFSSPDFTITEPGLIKSLWRTLIYVPLLNALVALLIYMLGHSLALSIILLTLIIRTLLLLPSQKAMKAQKRMQEIQPQIEELKKKYGNDQARLSQETMLLWKNNKVSPLSSCLPLLIQFPILIALYYTINGGLSPDKHSLIYSFLPTFSLNDVNPWFFNFNLLEKSLIVFPILTGGLQFIQMQLMSAKQKKKGAAKVSDEMQAANNMMKYVMPVMIATFTTRLPAAVGLYWAVSTFYGIVQQVVVNKDSSPTMSPQDDVQVRVIHRS